jgi:hypothetical protein
MQLGQEEEAPQDEAASVQEVAQEDAHRPEEV